VLVAQYAGERVRKVPFDMDSWVIRDMGNADLDGAIRVWDDSGVNSQEPVFSIAEVVTAVNSGAPAVVAVVEGRIVGTACSLLDDDRAWICRLAIANEWRKKGLGSELLIALQQRLTATGITRFSALLHDNEIGDMAFEHQGYRGASTLRYFDRRESYAANQADVVHRLGGRVIAANEWTKLSGGEETKELIERIIVLPLANATIAASAGLRPPGAAILFGPPGTGKTSLARGIAGRLGWPFIEVFPAQLGTTAADVANSIRETFDQLLEVDHAVVFIDEVDEIASHRQEASTGQVITNELLKVIPGFRSGGARLLICATNNIARLDTAFLRTGRFDFLIPVGPPDFASRHETLSKEITRITSAEIDIDSLAHRTEGYTVADLDHLVRTAAQSAFERALREGATSSLVQQDLEMALSVNRPSVNPDDAAAFAIDITKFARL